MCSISVDIRSSCPNIRSEWSDLLTRASNYNVFVSPDALNAVCRTKFTKVHVLLAWDDEAEPEQLVGVWALGESKQGLAAPHVLTAPAYDYAFISDPVIDRRYYREVATAFVKAIKDDAYLPKTMRVSDLDRDNDFLSALTAAVAGEGGQCEYVAQAARPIKTTGPDCHQSKSTRKKLRQDWNRLCKLGAVELHNDRSPPAVREAFEMFLSMENLSWKGEQGTALLSKQHDVSFARQLVQNLAAVHGASVAVLRLDGKPIAAQVLLYCGSTAFTWKIAYDRDYAKYSPGTVLVDQIGERILSSGQAVALDSCSAETGFMGQIWQERRSTVDLLMELRENRKIRFHCLTAMHRGYQRLRRLRREVFDSSPVRHMRKSAAKAGKKLGA